MKERDKKLFPKKSIKEIFKRLHWDLPLHIYGRIQGAETGKMRESNEYRLPLLEDEKEIKEYLKECFRCGETEVIICQDLLLKDFSKWVQMMQDNADYGNGDWGKSLLLFTFFDSRIVGILCVRYDLSPILQEQYGNIGYHVRPSERRKGYATQMLRQALNICKVKGLQSVIIGCRSDNAASKAVIKKCGGALIEQKERNSYYECKL